MRFLWCVAVMLMFAAGGRTFTLCARHAYTAGVDCDEATAAECSGISPVLCSFLAMVHRHDEHRKDACPRLPPRSLHQGIATQYISIVCYIAIELPLLQDIAIHDIAIYHYIAIVLALRQGIGTRYIAVVSVHCYCISTLLLYCHCSKVLSLMTLPLHQGISTRYIAFALLLHRGIATRQGGGV